MKKYILAFLISSLSLLAIAQNDLIINTEGMPPITTYVGTDYSGNNQVWDIIQDEHGLIYIATSYGLHEFDGTQWRKIEIAEGVVPRCFVKGQNGKIYLGGIDIIGYLELGKSGLTEFHSIADKLPEGINTGRQEFVNALNGKIFFSGFNSIIVYDETLNTLQHFDTQLRSYPNFVLNDKIYFKYDGLLTYENDTLVKVKSGDYFSGKAISDFMVYPGDSVIALSPTHQYHYFDGDTAFQKSYFQDPFLKDKFPYKLLNVSKDYNAICYLSAGLIITDKFWNPILHIDESAGINQQVYKAFLDAENNLWLATNFGISIVELASKYSYFDLTTGISGDISDFEEKNGNIYAAATTGLYYKAWKKDQNAVQRQNQKFEKIKNSDIYNDDFLPKSSPLLVKAYQTIGQVINGVYQRLYTKAETQSELTYLKDSTYALTIGKNGSSMQLFKNDGTKWSHVNSIENDVLPESIIFLKYDAKNDLIWGSNTTQLFSFTISSDLGSIENFKLYTTDDGLPSSSENFSISLGEEIIISTKSGVYQYDGNSRKFERSAHFENYFEEKRLTRVHKQNDSTYWYIAGNFEKGVLSITQNGLSTDWKMANVMPPNSINLYYSEGKGVLFGSTNSIGFLQEGKKENYGFEFSPLIRQLDIISGKDSTIFHGVFTASDGSISYAQQKPIELAYKKNSIRLSYSIPYYRHPDKIQYQYRLEGFEEGWSEWTYKTQKEYTNLPAGKYVFQVKAMNGFLTQSEVGQIKIKILAPWYQTWWAYLFYLLLFIGFIGFILILNSKRLKAENQKLEETIKERVKEIQEQKSVIAQSLVEKESLLKEIHHRVKNNLQIIANLLYLQSGKFQDENIKNVLEEGQGRVRSMALIHQKLYENEDLKSIPFGEYILELVNEIKTSFGELAASVTVKVDAQEAFFDVDSAVPLGLIINELSTNAFKYAFEGKEEGQFNIFLTRSGEEYELHISDNGKGIPDEIDIRKTRSLGLRLVRILSEQLEGEYSFESESGMSFKLKFVA